MGAFDMVWDEIHLNNDWGKYPSEHIIRFIARNYYGATNRNDIKILDFGCGGGAHTWYLAREGFSTFAFDGSKIAIDKLSHFLDKEQLTADLRVLDGVHVDYDNNFFDGVIDNVCIYANKMEDIVKMYAEVYRVLKQGGKFISSVFSTDTLGYGEGREIEKNTFTDISSGRLQGRGTTHFFEKDELKKVLKNVGFENLIIDEMRYSDLGENVGMYIAIAKK